VSAIKAQAGQPSGARAAARFRTSLVTAQIALSMALLMCAGLFVKSLTNVSRVDLGIKVDNVIVFGVSPGLNGYTPERSKAFYERLEQELGSMPGATGVAMARIALLAGNNSGTNVSVEGFSSGPDTDSDSNYNEINPGYFRTLGVPLIAGREFTAADSDTAPKVAIVNEAFAKKFNLGATPSASTWREAKESSTSKSSGWCRTPNTARSSRRCRRFSSVPIARPAESAP
jgi:hypothetical protein